MWEGLIIFPLFRVMGNIVKCRFNHCDCDKELNKEEAIQKGKAYYHPECYQIMQNIGEIRRLFIENINRNASASQLSNVINTIIFTKGIQSDYLLFGLKYYISNKLGLNYPQGLYYVIQNKDVEKAWKKEKSKSVKRIISIEDDYDLSPTFNYHPYKQKTIGDIFDE